MNPDFDKYPDGLVPAVVQDYKTQKVLMLGFMNAEALKKTEETGLVTFYSRSKKGYGQKVRRAAIIFDCGRSCWIAIRTPF